MTTPTTTPRGGDPPAVSLRDYVDGQADELRRDLAQFAAERDRAAAVLREEAFRSVEQGDTRLREHIENQIEQIRAALRSAELLEVERVNHVTSTVVNLKNELAIASHAQKEAINKADAASERRFEAVNEFRQTLSDQTMTFMPRVETEQRIQTNSDKVEALARTMYDKMDAMTRRFDQNEGRSSGQGSLVTYIFAAVGALGALVAIAMAFYNASRK